MTESSPAATFPTFAPFRRFLQIAYVTTDLDEAMRCFGADYGVANWMPMPGMEVETAPGRSCHNNIALAYVGPMQLELIEPLSGDDAIYRAALPDDGSGVRFHHVAQLFGDADELESAEGDARRLGIPIAMAGSSAGGLVRYFYTDHRNTLGHYIEHIWYAPEMMAFLEQIPRN